MRHQLCLHPQPLPSSFSWRLWLPPSTPQNPDCHEYLTLTLVPRSVFQNSPKEHFSLSVGAQQWGSSAPPGKGNALPRNSRCSSLPPAPRNELLLFHLPWRQKNQKRVCPAAWSRNINEDSCEHRLGNLDTKILPLNSLRDELRKNQIPMGASDIPPCPP